MKTYQKGYTLTEIMIAVGVVAALVIGGLGFYNHAIMKAQANQSMTAAKIIVDDVIDYYARFSSLPADHGNLSGDFIPQGNSYVAKAEWLRGQNPVQFNVDTAGVGAAWGFVQVTFKTTGLQQALKSRIVKFYLIESDYRSFLEYHGCLTDIDDGMLDGSTVPADHTGSVGGPHHPILPECKKGAGPTLNEDTANLTSSVFPSTL
jgi:prepilin-type N-terminal cleavage/methylation domain-containing protein